MRKILEQIIFKSLFEDTIKTVIKQAPRSVVDKARALKGYAFRIQSTRTGGTVDIDTLVKRVRINDQYGENSHTSDDKWVYIFGADLRDADRKFFCNVLILPVDAAIKIYGKDGEIDAQRNGLIGTAPVYQELAMAKPTAGQVIDKGIEITKAVLSNKEPVKEPIKQGELEKPQAEFTQEFTTDSSGNVFDADGNIVKLVDADGNPIETKPVATGDEIIIKMPKDGFKKGMKDNVEFAKLQQYLIDVLKSPNGAELYNHKDENGVLDFKPLADKFIRDGADGDYGTTTAFVIAWFCWAIDYVDIYEGAFVDITLANKFLTGQSKVTVIAESRLAYKPRYMTIIESKILQEQLKLNVNKPLPPSLVKTKPIKVADPKVNPKVNPKVDPKIQKLSPEQQKKILADVEKAKKMANDAAAVALAQTKKAAAEKTSGGSGLMRSKYNGAVFPVAVWNMFRGNKERKATALATTTFKPLVYGKNNLIVRTGIDTEWQSLQGYTSHNRGYDYLDWLTTANWYYNTMTKGATIGTDSIIKDVYIEMFWKQGNPNPEFHTWYYIVCGKRAAWFPSKWFEIPK